MGTTALCRWSSPSLGLLHLSSSSVSRRPVRVSCSSRQLSSPSSVDKTILQIKNSGVIACLRANSAEVALEAAHAAIAGGISVLEIVMSTPGVFEVLQELVKDYPTMALGVGTVLRVEDAEAAIISGAKFLMSPAFVKDVLDYVQCHKVLFIPGVMTPTEILSAFDAGSKMVKIYPASALGGFQYISALKKPFPQIPMIASQGITIDSIGEYIARGASSVVLSDAIFDKEAIAQYNFGKIYQLASSAALLGNEAVERQCVTAQSASCSSIKRFYHRLHKHIHAKLVQAIMKWIHERWLPNSRDLRVNVLELKNNELPALSSRIR